MGLVPWLAKMLLLGQIYVLTLQVPEKKMAEFADSEDLDVMAHNEPPHIDLHYLPSSLWIFNMIYLGLNIF